MLQISNLSFAYGATPVLKQVSVALAPGRFTALLGPNGAGKSTLLALITRQLQAPPGAVRIDGRDVATDGARALAQVGIVFQAPTLDLDLTVDQNLLYFGGLQGLSPQHTGAAAAPWLDRFELGAKRGQKVRTLSGGQRRRVELVRALLHDPKWLLLDEPTTGLDVPTRRMIVHEAHALAEERGLGVLWATHLVDEVQETDDLIVLQQGQVVDSGAYAQVVQRLGTSDLEAIAGGTTSGATPPPTPEAAS